MALLVQEGGALVKRLESGPANFKLLKEGQLEEQLACIGKGVPKPAAICIGLAGVRTIEDQQQVLRATAKVWPAVPVRACSDLETALATAEQRTGSTQEQAHVLVLSGTGSCCYGQGADGRTAKIGGWGHLLGDKGSAYQIGLRALKAVVYYYDRDGKWTTLGSAILRALLLNAPEDLVNWAQGASKTEIAALAVEVFSAWQRRDKIAGDILAGAAESLARDAVDCARRLGAADQPVRFVFAGGVLLKQIAFGKAVERELKRRWPKAEVVRLEKESAWGAVRLAQEVWEKFGASASESAMDRRLDKGARRVDQAELLLKESDGSNQGPIPQATAPSPTERRNAKSRHLDTMGVEAAVALMLREEAAVPRVLLGQAKTITRCVRMIVRSLRAGGRLFYVGAGTSGRLGVLDASECPPTFRAPPEQVQGIIAGGQKALWQSIEGAEDDVRAGAQAVGFRGVRKGDVVVGIAASGRTPFVWGALEEARRRRAKTALVCFNPNLRFAHGHRPEVVLAFDLGAEVLTGSTRLKAGTATKLLLNAFTTVSMVQLGKVASNLMVDLNPSNRKLRQRAIRIVRELTGTNAAQATAALEESGWVVKQALRKLNCTGGLTR